MDKRLSITAQQRLVIRCIGACAGLTPGALADLLHVDPGTVSATLSRLQDKRLVSRHKDPSDLRRAFISLTARGRALDRPTDGTVESAVQALLSQTSTADIETTVRVLTTLANLLDEQHTPRARTPLDEVPG